MLAKVLIIIVLLIVEGGGGVGKGPFYFKWNVIKTLCLPPLFLSLETFPTVLMDRICRPFYPKQTCLCFLHVCDHYVYIAHLVLSQRQLWGNWLRLAEGQPVTCMYLSFYIDTLALLEDYRHWNCVICPDTCGWFYLCFHQIQVFKEKPIQAHIAEIDLSLWEAPSDKDESSYIVPWFRYVWFLAENVLTIYTRSFSSATSEGVKREAMIMMSLQHQNTPFP